MMSLEEPFVLANRHGGQPTALPMEPFRRTRFR